MDSSVAVLLLIYSDVNKYQNGKKFDKVIELKIKGDIYCLVE